MKGISINILKPFFVLAAVFFIAASCGRSAYGNEALLKIAMPGSCCFFSKQKTGTSDFHSQNSPFSQKLKYAGGNYV